MEAIQSQAIHALWTFPAIILAALLISWAAECGQFYISQGLALAVLAWVQTLPEFAVEATIALEAAKNPAQMHLITANFTGSLRLFVGLGWPMVYFVSLFFGRKRFFSKSDGFWKIHMEDEHAVAILSLVPTLLYFLFIYFKGSLNALDGFILAGIYLAYLWLLSKLPPQPAEGIEDCGRVPKKILAIPPPGNYLGMLLMFFIGGLILWFAAHPFLDSMLAVAAMAGISQFVFVQWVAPFLSEFPEKLSAFNWARRVSKAPMALANFVSSSLNQWTILVATVPFIYAYGLGHFSPILFDAHQKEEILLTLVQSYLGFLFLASMDFSFIEAFGLFWLWIIQFFWPGVRGGITVVYALWAIFETIRLIVGYKHKNAFSVFSKLMTAHFFKRT